ncbi:hypothetical protein [Gemmata sp.]|uniref:hypothetical protein n=1 Tax=Gemmata sp. TaxID=1914242 RepID=UPI003F720465
MRSEPREPAAAESYPTFWVSDAAPAPVLVPAVLPEEAYAAFVDCTEDEFPADAVPSTA